MFNIEGTGVWLAYLLCLASTILCVIYGLATWNKGDEPLEREDVTWVSQEKQVDESL